MDSHVFDRAISQGLETDDFFGYASGKDGDQYLGFVFGRNTIVTIDGSALLIEKDTALRYQELTKLKVEKQSESEKVQREEKTGTDTITKPKLESVDAQVIKKQFYGTIDLDPIRAKMQFSEIVDEVVQQFTAKLGVDVEISIEVRAASRDGFDESVQRTIKENCNVLKFGNAEFE